MNCYFGGSQRSLKTLMVPNSFSCDELLNLHRIPTIESYGLYSVQRFIRKSCFDTSVIAIE